MQSIKNPITFKCEMKTDIIIFRLTNIKAKTWFGLHSFITFDLIV